MNAQSILPGLKSWFEDYTREFSSEDPNFQENIDLKTEHTRRVCEAILDIGGSLDLPDEDQCMAEVTALMHDIGRFEQYKKYGTFSDYRSEDHAALGVKVIKHNRVLEGLEPDKAGIILRVIAYHNYFSLPAGEEENCLFFLKLLRDADKVDIWRVVTDYYQNSGNKRNQTLDLDLPDTDRISDPVYKALINRELARMADLKTLNDFKLLQIGWIYDVNFQRTFQIIRERGYLEKIRDALPKKSTRVSEIYERAEAYLERNI
jgi:HD superfamily phosphodiesterase